ncbi:MAG: hypothetical protein ABEI74_04765 [Candidatus Pacearchaeota archaeon]
MAFTKRTEDGKKLDVKQIRPRVPFKGIRIESSQNAMKPKTKSLRKGLKKRLKS